MYKIQYLPRAKKDIEEIVTYISEELSAPKAALNLLDELERSISRLQDFPYICKVYTPKQNIDLEYRVLVVKNYMVFYIVIDNTVEIHRVIYGKMNLSSRIKFFES